MTSRALVDTTVLYAAGNRRAKRYERASEIVRAADHGELPVLGVPDVVLVETMNGLTRDVGHETAVGMLTRLQSGSRFDLGRDPQTVWTSGLDVFETIERLSLADSVIVAGMHHHAIEYVYSFDGGFDGLDGVTRLTTAENPYAPD